MKMKYFGLSDTKLLHFHKIFKNAGGGGVKTNPMNPLWICHFVHTILCFLIKTRRGEWHFVMLYSLRIFIEENCETHLQMYHDV